METTDVIILMGMPGSGKSTLAKQFFTDTENSIIINRDSFRQMMVGDNNDKGSNFCEVREEIARALRNVALRKGLAGGKKVIIDDTNLSGDGRKDLIEILQQVADKQQININVQFVYIHEKLQTCIDRDRARVKPVGEAVIKEFYQKYITNCRNFPVEQPVTAEGVYVGVKYITPLTPAFEPVVQDITKPRAIIVDVDGTLAIMKDRGPYDWEKVGQDELNVQIANIVRRYAETHAVIILTGRDGICESETREWLTKHGIIFHRLFIRRQGDIRKDNVVKHEIFTGLILPNYHVDFVLDDRDQVVAMWRKIGLTCLQVNYGDF